jgi:hypothetical protein
LPDVAVMALSALAEPRLPRPFAGTTAPQSAPTGAAAGDADVVGRGDGVAGADVGCGDERGAVARGVKMTGPAPPVGLAVMVVDVLPQEATANSAMPATTANRTLLASQDCRRMTRYLPSARHL